MTLPRRLDRSVPFVLLDDARPAGASARLFRDPVEQVVAHAQAERAGALAAVRAGLARGLHAAGYVAYEAGALAEPPGPGRSEAPLLWFGLFERCEEVAANAVPDLLPDPAGAWAAAPRPAIPRADYLKAVAAVQRLIAAGDIYQANLTFPARVAVAGDPLALYARLRTHAAAGWGGLLFDGRRTVLSLSPELFFHLHDGRITARPMKGTAPRLPDPAADADAVRALAADPKQRAENLMIVDLIRNDLARVAVPGSVAVPELFTVESHPTVHQMTSTVTAQLAPGQDALAVLEASFPCGSITGAPKLRAMKIAAEAEARPRGLYTGAIGYASPGGAAAFNVAIRTLVMEDGEEAVLGLGSGIVADSHGPAEWRECLAKGAFVAAACPRFDLLETMRFDPELGVCDLDRHLARLRASADALGFAIDRHAIRNELQAATFRLREAARVRMRVGAAGAVAIEVRALAAPPAGAAPVSVVPLPVAADDFRLAHKTSARGFYDRARAAAGGWEVVFERPDGLLTEGSFTSLFVARDGRLITPPLSRGLLPGVLRARLLDEGRAVEGDLTRDDLRDGFLLGNAVRGLVPCAVVPARDIGH